MVFRELVYLFPVILGTCRRLILSDAHISQFYNATGVRRVSNCLLYSSGEGDASEKDLCNLYSTFVAFNDKSFLAATLRILYDSDYQCEIQGLCMHLVSSFQ